MCVCVRWGKKRDQPTNGQGFSRSRIGKKGLLCKKKGPFQQLKGPSLEFRTFLQAVGSVGVVIGLKWVKYDKGHHYKQEMTVLYLYLVVWGVTDWTFSVWAIVCTYSGDLCHFSPILAQLPPPATWPLFYFASVDGATKMFISWFWNQYYLKLVCTESSLVLLISKGKESLGWTAFGLILRDIVFDLEHNHSGCSVMDYPIWYGVG